MAGTTVLVTGVTGYIFSLMNAQRWINPEFLDLIPSGHKQFAQNISIGPEQREGKYSFGKEHQRGHFDDDNAIEQLQNIGAGFDIVIDPAFTFLPSYCEALIAGQGRRKRASGKEVYYIHQCGTGNIANQPISNKFTETRTYSDKENIQAYQRFRESVETFGQRTSDLAVLGAGLKENVKTTSVMSPTIFGKGAGHFNQTTIQVPLPVRTAVKLGHPVVVRDGSGIWNLVSIEDLCSLYAILGSRILSGEDIANGEKGVIFSENGSFSWLELVLTIAEVGVQLGKLDTVEIAHLSPEQAAGLLFPAASICEVALGSTSLTKAELAREYGWNPVHSKKDLLEDVREVFLSVTSAGFKRCEDDHKLVVGSHCIGVPLMCMLCWC